jgi:23S rRNA pseudouridine1911/1915/1917 synthase
MVIAKTDHAMQYLSRQFAERTIKKTYLTLVWGDVEQEKGKIDGHIGRHPRYRKKMTVFPDGEKGKPAVTHYEVKERFGFVTLLACYPKTGCTHQIRVHLKNLNHPVFQDKKYGGDKLVQGLSRQSYRKLVNKCFKILPRQALHAHKIRFTHPADEQLVTYESPLPDDFQNVLEAWRDYVQALYQE